MGRIGPLPPPRPGGRQTPPAGLLLLGGDVGRVAEEEVHTVAESLSQALHGLRPDHLHRGLVLTGRGEEGFASCGVDIRQQEIRVGTLQTRLWSDRQFGTVKKIRDIEVDQGKKLSCQSSLMLY